MKWGRKNVSSSSSSSQPSLITHVFPASWFSRFKKKKCNFEPMSVKTKSKKKNVQEHLSPSTTPLKYPPWKEGRFYSRDDDPYWRLSFGDEGAEKSKTWKNTALDDHHHPPQVSISNSANSNMEQPLWMFHGMTSSSSSSSLDVKTAKEISDKAGNSLQDEKFVKKTVKDQRSKKLKRRAFQEKREELANTTEKAMFEVQPKRIIQGTREEVRKSVVSESRYRRSFSFPNSNLRTIEEDCILKSLNLETSSNVFPRVVEEEEEINLQCNRLEDMQIKEMKTKSKQDRGSVYIERNSQRKRRKQSSRTRCSSPRTAAKIECKIKALEDMKKAKMKKMKSKESTTTVRDASAFESYAVAKSSYDPQKDFRDSMIEMIMEKGIQTPEELEQLLACYLTLNYDEYHDLIIKVFRQVYFELNQMYFTSELQHYLHCNN